MPHILIAEARFYPELTDMLADAAIAVLDKAGASYERIALPGCFELPTAIAIASRTKDYDGYIALGCVIRGETSHYDHVCNEVARGLNHLSTRKRLALGFGIVTAENKAQALARADGRKRDVGGNAARACLSLLEWKKRFKKHKTEAL